MTADLNLRDLERKAWRSYHQDGLKDIFLGLILLAVGVSQSMGSVLALVGIEVIAIVLLVASKRYITTPRLGRVEFSSERKAKKLRAVFMVGICALVGVGAYLALAGMGGASRWLADHRELLYVGVGLWIFLLLSLIAYWLDFTRLYWIALVIGATFSCTFWFKAPAVFILSGLVVLIPGLVLFVRFLRRYPLPPASEPSASRRS